jgi:serine/threonine protein phosphatase PrpC
MARQLAPRAENWKKKLMSFAVSKLMRDFKGGNHVTGVNVGDSRVKLGKKKKAAQDITFDHKPDSLRPKGGVKQRLVKRVLFEKEDGSRACFC